MRTVLGRKCCPRITRETAASSFGLRVLIATAVCVAVSFPAEPEIGGGTTAVHQTDASDAAPVVPQHIVTLLAAGRSGGTLDGEVAWAVVPFGERAHGGWQTQLVAQVDLSNLLRAQPNGELEIGVYGYIFSETGELVAPISRSITVEPARIDRASAVPDLCVVHRADLPPGAYSARIAIEEGVSGQHFLGLFDFEVPAASQNGPILLPVLAESSDQGWLVFETGDEAAPVGSDGTADQAFVALPTATFDPGHPTEFLLAGTGWDGGVEVTARMIDASGVDRARPGVRVERIAQMEKEGRLFLRATVEPPNIPAGLYSLLLTVRDRSSVATVSRAARIRPAAAGGLIVLTSDSDRPALEAATPVVLEAREIGSVSAQTVALLLSGQRGGEIAGSLIWTVSPGTDHNGLTDVLLFVDVDGSTLLGDRLQDRLDVGFFAYVFSDEGMLVEHLAQGLSLDLQVYEGMLLARGLKFAGRVSLPPGGHFVRLLVRNQTNDRVFLTQARIDVPDGANDDRLLLPPLFEEAREGWVMARQSDFGSDALGVQLSGATLLPASRVVAETGQTAELVLGGKGWDASSRISARIADSQSRQLAEPVITIDRLLDDGSGTIEFFHATLGPIDLPPGFYTLEVMLDDEITGARLSRYLPLAVVIRGRPLVLRAALGGVVRPRSLTTRGAAPGLSHEEIAARYADALQLLGEGERYAAREALLELERLALGSGSQREFVALARIERQLVREMAETDPGVLRPISLLHRDVLRQQAAFDEQRLVDHSWPMAAEFAEQAWETRRPGEDESFARTLLVALAADLIRIAAVSPAIELLNRALEIAPDDPAALLALGATYERSGRYEEAIGPLRTLVSEHPENAEGELRLAINLARASQMEDAKDHFRALIADSAPTWITVIAYQELARLLPAVNAESILREGFQRFPSNQALQVELAYVLDDLGRTGEAADLVESISRSGGAPETSPRVRYPAWPSLGLEGRITVLEEEATAALPAVVAALDATRAAETAEDQT